MTYCFTTSLYTLIALRVFLVFGKQSSPVLGQHHCTFSVFFSFVVFVFYNLGLTSWSHLDMMWKIGEKKFEFNTQIISLHIVTRLYCMLHFLKIIKLLCHLILDNVLAQRTPPLNYLVSKLKFVNKMFASTWDAQAQDKS